MVAEHPAIGGEQRGVDRGCHLHVMHRLGDHGPSSEAGRPIQQGGDGLDEFLGQIAVGSSVLSEPLDRGGDVNRLCHGSPSRIEGDQAAPVGDPDLVQDRDRLGGVPVARHALQPEIVVPAAIKPDDRRHNDLLRAGESTEAAAPLAHGGVIDLVGAVVHRSRPDIDAVHGEALAAHEKRLQSIVLVQPTTAVQDFQRRMRIMRASQVSRPARRFVGMVALARWGDLLYAVRTANTAFDHVHGHGVWDHRVRHPEEAEVFDRAMAARTEQIAEAVPAACDFSRFAQIVDVGGGDGSFLARILGPVRACAARSSISRRRWQGPRPCFASLGLSDRCHAVGGNFFVGVPEGGDAYVLKAILHDWDDTAAAGILSTCRRAMKPEARLIVIEHVIGPPNGQAHAKFLDLHMLVMTGGRERTREEFAALLRIASFRLVSVTPTPTQLCVIEGVPEAL
jgi:hypothetical protein